MDAPPTTQVNPLVSPSRPRRGTRRDPCIQTSNVVAMKCPKKKNMVDTLGQ
jgi:hypothetical protein